MKRLTDLVPTSRSSPRAGKLRLRAPMLKAIARLRLRGGMREWGEAERAAFGTLLQALATNDEVKALAHRAASRTPSRPFMRPTSRAAVRASSTVAADGLSEDSTDGEVEDVTVQLQLESDTAHDAGAASTQRHTAARSASMEPRRDGGHTRDADSRRSQWLRQARSVDQSTELSQFRERAQAAVVRRRLRQTQSSVGVATRTTRQRRVQPARRDQRHGTSRGGASGGGGDLARAMFRIASTSRAAVTGGPSPHGTGATTSARFTLDVGEAQRGGRSPQRRPRHPALAASVTGDSHHNRLHLRLTRSATATGSSTAGTGRLRVTRQRRR